jgi:hypothetical protein
MPRRSKRDHAIFGWTRLRSLFGTPLTSPALKALFRATGKDLLVEERVGVYSMPPHDKQPCPMLIADLSPGFGVRLHFRHARLLASGKGLPPTEFLFDAVTYDLEKDEDQEAFTGDLPYGILATDDKDRVLERAGRPPTHDSDAEPAADDEDEEDDLAFVRWEDQDPHVHVLFRKSEGHPILLQVYLKPVVL